MSRPTTPASPRFSFIEREGELWLTATGHEDFNSRIAEQTIPDAVDEAVLLTLESDPDRPAAVGSTCASARITLDAEQRALLADTADFEPVSIDKISWTIATTHASRMHFKDEAPDDDEGSSGHSGGDQSSGPASAE